mmetsp:Transcript_10155/g.28959  ORF Transcript_10155/g.28959 Transcript_10155/m.28959 type:complete len:209 (-) Transcript_10155:1095-1721(-)
MPRSHARYHQDLLRPVLLPRYALGLLHQQRAESLVLELRRVPLRNGHGGSVHVELADDAGRHVVDLLEEGGRARLPQPQQADEDVLRGVLVRDERLPTLVGDVVAADELHLVGGHLAVNLLHPDLTRPDVPARQVPIPHLLQRQLSQIPVLHAAAHERHGDVPLDAVQSRPRWHQAHHLGREFHQLVGRVILVSSRLPQLVQPGASDD